MAKHITAIPRAIKLVSVEAFHVILISGDLNIKKKHDIEMKTIIGHGPVVSVRCFRLGSIRSWLKSHQCQRVYILDHQVQTTIKKGSQL